MGYKKSVQIAPPAHLKLKIDCFSLFLDSARKIDRYESDVFEVAGYKWILYLYPSGYSQQGGKDYLSLYLAIAETHTLPSGWDVTVNSKMFLFNHIDGDFLTIQDDKAWRFHQLKTEWGIPRLISQIDLRDDYRGFLCNDTFICGVEIYPVKHSGKGETLSLINCPENTIHAWKITSFSQEERKITLPVCSLGGLKFETEIHRNGILAKDREFISCYIKVVSDADSIPPGTKLYIKYKLRLKNQLGKLNHVKTGSQWFTSTTWWGFGQFISLRVLNDPSEGYLKDDSIILQLEIISMSRITLLP